MTGGASEPNTEQVSSNGYHRSEKRQVSLTTLIFGILRHPWIMIISVVAIILPSIYLLLNVERQYRSYAVVMVPLRETGFSAMDLIGGGGTASKPEHYYISILNGNAYRVGVAREIARKYPDLTSDSLYRPVMGAINFERNPQQPGLFMIFGVSPEPRLARIYAECAVDVFQSRISTLDQQEAQAIVEFIDQQLDEINRKSIEAEENLHDFLRENNFVIENIDAGISTELFKLVREHSETQAGLEMANLKIEATEKQIRNLLDQVVPDHPSGDLVTIEELRTRLDSVRARLEADELSEADALMLEEEKKRTIARLVNLLSGSAGGMDRGISALTLQRLEKELEQALLESKSFESKLSFYSIQLERFRKQHPNISEDILEYSRLVQAQDVLKTTLSILLEKREEARIQVASQLGSLKVIDAPQKAVPIARRTIQKFIFILIFAVFAGSGVSLLIEILSDSIEDEKNITDNFDLQVLGSISVIPSNGERRTRRDESEEHIDRQKKLLINFSEQSPIAELYRTIKTSILFVAQDEHKHIFVVSSAVPDEGKTITTANLAISIAQGGKQVLLIDADLRRPTQHAMWGILQEPGLTDFLFGKASSEQVIRETRQDNLFVLPAGNPPSNPAELLGSRKMGEFLQEIREKYDVTLIDTSPVNVAVDSRVLASIADGMILVVKSEFTTRKSLRYALSFCDRLGVEIVGVVLNHAQKRYSGLYYYTHHYFNQYPYYDSYGYKKSYRRKGQSDAILP